MREGRGRVSRGGLQRAEEDAGTARNFQFTATRIETIV
jgi:hypothetical protein